MITIILRHAFALSALFATVPAGAAQYGPVVWGAQKLDVREFDQPFVKIAAGEWHTVGLKSDGTVVAWGGVDEEANVVPVGLSGVIAIAAGQAHTVVLKSDGTVGAWQKYNDWFQSDVPVGLTGVTAIAAGGHHTVALKGDGGVVAWGDDRKGQVTVPAGLSGVTAIAAGGGHTVALKGDGTVVAWGDNEYGQTKVPTGLSGVTAIAGGANHTVALKGDGTLMAWGSNLYGETTVPIGLTGVIAIAAGDWVTVALKSDGTVVAWGANVYGQASVPAGLADVTAIAAGGVHMVALKGDGTVVGWGNNEGGQAVATAQLSGVTAIAAGARHTVAVKGDGTVVAWGENGKGQTNVPAALREVMAVAAGETHTVALKRDGTVVAWGDNSYGQSTVPAGLTGVIGIAAGWQHTLALKRSGTVVAWGSNFNGQRNVPSGLSGVTAIAAGRLYSVALKGNGTVVSWGNGPLSPFPSSDYGKGNIAIAAGDSHTVLIQNDGSVLVLGDNSSHQRERPAGLTGITAVATRLDHTLALKPDGTVVAWGGFNTYGERTVPAGLTGVSAIAAGDSHSVALVSPSLATVPNANLAALLPTAGTLSPPFASATTSYTMNVPSGTTEIIVTPTVEDATSTATVNGVTVASGAASRPIPLRVGTNTITVVVTARNLITKKTYRLVVTREQAPIVATRLVNGTTLSPVTAPGAVTLHGSAKDDLGVSRVLVSLNDGTPVPANLVPGANAMAPVNWSLTVVPENGFNTLTAQAVDAQNNVSKPRTIVFRYVVLRLEHTGTYTGLAMPTVDETHAARQVGFSSFTVSKSGAFTGRLRLGGSPAAIPLSATFGNGGDARFWINKAAASTLEIKRTGLPSLFLALNLDVTAPLSHQITGTLTENGTVVSNLTLDRALYTAAKTLVPPLKRMPLAVLNPLTDKGAYTGILQAIAPPNEGVLAANYPQGDGWALTRVKSSGTVTVAGKLGDGKPFAFSGPLSQANVLPFYVKLYGGTGTLSGPVTFRDVPGQSDADGIGLRWFKPANPKDTAYPAGWPNGIKVDFLGSKFILPAKATPTNPRPFYLFGTDNVLGLQGMPTPAAVTVNLADGGITPPTDISKAAVDGRNKVTITPPVDPVLNLKAAFPTDIITHMPTGKLTGSFKHPGNNKTVPFSGVVYQKLHTAAGYFLYYPPKPLGLPAPSGVSGSVGIGP